MALLLMSSTVSWTTQEIFTRLCLRIPLTGSSHYCDNYFTSIRQHFELTTVCRASQLICNPVPASKSARYMRHCDTRVMPAVVSLSNVEDQVGACVHLSRISRPTVNDEQLRAREKERERARDSDIQPGTSEVRGQVDRPLPYLSYFLLHFSFSFSLGCISQSQSLTEEKKCNSSTSLHGDECL